jgi:hypothetical protein
MKHRTPRPAPPSRLALRRRGGALVAALAVAVSLAAAACTPAGGGGGGSTGSTSSSVPTDYSACPTPGPGQVRVATVVQGAGLAGFAQPEVVCVVVAQGSSGLTALNARATRLGVPSVRLNGSGLLCAIGGLPSAPACGDVGPDGPEYWSYWLPDGSGGWTYAPVGPASRSMQEGAVEGWRWVPGGTAAAPVHSSSFNSLVTL